MSKTVKTKKPDELDLLFSEKDPFATKAKQPRRRNIAQELLEAPKPNTDGLSTWSLLKELYKRHSATVYITGFWLELAIIIYGRTK